MHRYELAVLKALKGKNDIGIDDLASASNIGRDEVMWGLENLKTKGLVEVTYTIEELFKPTAEGTLYSDHGFPEVLLVKEIVKKKSMRASELRTETQRIGLQWAKNKGWIEIRDGNVHLTNSGERAADEEGIAVDRSEQVRRGLATLSIQKSIKNVSITKAGIRALEEDRNEELIDAIDRSMIAGEAWKGRPFKRYDVNVNVERHTPALKHPIKRMLDELKDAYASMGFREVSGPAVDSSFWVFDSLFVPQDHPARDAQDTFYASNLEKAALEKVPHVKTIRRAHEKGWHTKWSEDVAGQMLLRTHTTSISAKYIYSIVNDFKKNPDRYDLPVKLFSIGKVFRNETVDYRHLADFYQHDGIIIGKNLTLSNLFDQLIKIYSYIGMKIKFKPSYFPFVEPGMEFMAYSEKTGEWIEMGGAGMIREEITGIRRSKLSVLAWGPGVDRILLIKDPSVSNISELYNNGLGWIRNRSGA